MNDIVLTPSEQGLIQENVCLKNKNWFQTGGFARFFAASSTTVDFQQAILFGLKHKLPIYLLGKGANILIADQGVDGLVIQPQLNSIVQLGENSDGTILVRAGAGVSMSDLISWCLERNVVGLEEFSGIPSSVGGAVYINLHYFEYLLEQFLFSAELIDARTGICEQVPVDWFSFGYDYSRLQEKTHYVASATFALKKVDDCQTWYAKGRSVEIIRHRASRYPQTHTCGCFFRNLYEHEVDFEINGKKILSAGYYLDSLGIKGNLSVGGASISSQHANMIINNENATSQNIIDLALKMQWLVKEKYGILLKPECQFLGIDKKIFDN